MWHRPAPAGFWQRAAAWSLDAVPVALLALVVSWPGLRPALARLAPAGDPALHALADAMADVLRAQVANGPDPAGLPFALLPAATSAATTLTPLLWSLLWPPLLAFAGLAVLWHGSFEASHWQASPGKRLLGLRVVAADGTRPGIGRAFARQLAGGLSWLVLNLGHAMALAGPEYRALHDRLAGTRMLADRPGLPRWARGWLAVAIVAPAAAGLAAAMGLVARLQYLLDQALWY
ncbi:RDD family protein [Lysobacter sp. GX 14042]|uniref:RDD family protein n=1 Tax=Lysobacter sp. GX 14042 TaxID=2907155 RepID=UPI001F187AFA|nr:RDD family protein [Lysobacter sp. GX 14042]MCE7032406.1 RDD family protein [Lysobacter sp. GX 14042]